MSVTHVKALVWLVAAGLGAYLSWFVVGFFSDREALAVAPSTAEQTDVLESVVAPEPPREDVVAYDKVQRTFHQMNWTGKAPPKAPEAAPPPPPPPPSKKPVSELLRVMLVTVDVDAPAGSRAVVRWLDPKLQSAAGAPSGVLRVDERLPRPFEGIRVAAILADGVHFDFPDDPEREEEVVAPQSAPTDRTFIVAVGEDGVREPAREPIRPATTYGAPRTLPRETMQIGPNRWLVGQDDREYLRDNYSKAMAEIGFRRHRDPVTGQVDGIEITSVPAGSTASKYGVEEGQVIKSINGHPVQSPSEAISYVKQNQDKYDEWVVVYEQQGKEYTKIIDSSDYD